MGYKWQEILRFYRKLRSLRCRILSSRNNSSDKETGRETYPLPWSFYNEARAELLEKIVQIAPKGLTRAFLGNSGTEAVECAIKTVRKFTKKPEIIAMMGGFYGKTMGDLSATWKKKYRKPFQPLVPYFKHAQRYNIQKIKEAVTEKTAAIIVEPVQGEGGVIVPQRVSSKV